MDSVKKALIIGLVGASLTAAAPYALAQATGLKLSGWYLGGSIGQSEFGDVDCPPIPGAKCDDKDTTWKVFGGYKINRNFAVEAGYADLGSFDRTAPGLSASVDAKIFDLVGVGAFPLANNFSLYGKFGLYRSDVDAQALGKTKNNDWTYGVGAQYNFTQNLAARLEWQRYQSVEFKRVNGTTGDGDIDVVNVGVLFAF